jgi:hypothetical protein
VVDRVPYLADLAGEHEALPLGLQFPTQLQQHGTGCHVDGGLTAGLIAIGIPEGTAASTAIAYRLATFYLPPLWRVRDAMDEEPGSPLMDVTRAARSWVHPVAR